MNLYDSNNIEEIDLNHLLSNVKPNFTKVMISIYERTYLGSRQVYKYDFLKKSNVLHNASVKNDFDVNTFMAIPLIAMIWGKCSTLQKLPLGHWPEKPLEVTYHGHQHQVDAKTKCYDPEL